MLAIAIFPFIFLLSPSIRYDFELFPREELILNNSIIPLILWISSNGVTARASLQFSPIVVLRALTRREWCEESQLAQELKISLKQMSQIMYFLEQVRMETSLLSSLAANHCIPA